MVKKKHRQRPQWANQTCHLQVSPFCLIIVIVQPFSGEFQTSALLSEAVHRAKTRNSRASPGRPLARRFGCRRCKAMILFGFGRDKAHRSKAGIAMPRPSVAPHCQGYLCPHCVTSLGPELRSCSERQKLRAAPRHKSSAGYVNGRVCK